MQHVDPIQAVQVHQDLLSKKSLGIHWGTFKLANEVRLKKLSLELSFFYELNII